MRLPHCLAFFYYLPWFVDVYGKKVITSKTQCNAENACGNRMWQLGLRPLAKRRGGRGVKSEFMMMDRIEQKMDWK